MIDKVKDGTKPTVILREIKNQNPELRNFEISQKFHEECEGISGEAIQAIWYWKWGGREGGYSDDELDDILMKALYDAHLL